MATVLDHQHKRLRDFHTGMEHHELEVSTAATLSAFCGVVSGNTSRMLVVSVACVRLEKS
jgi:hypothetical protein